VSGNASQPDSGAWDNSGGKFYISDQSGGLVYSYTLTTPYDISTASFNQSFDVSGQDGTPVGIAWSGTGDKLFVCGQDNNTVFEYKLSSDFDLSTASFTSNTLDVSTEVDFTTDIAWKNDGVEFYTIDLSNIFQYGTDFFGW
jgi:sugar lactone lactonase YvrE